MQSVRMYGTAWCSDCKRAKKFLGEHRVPYEFIDVDGDAEGLAVVERVNQGKRIIPTIFFEDGSTLMEPTNAELAEKLGLQTTPQNPFYDLVIVGGGPTSLTAAIYAAREGIETLVAERDALGGQARVTERLDNYPGFPEGITGTDFADRLVAQCRRFGVELLPAAEVTTVSVDGQYRAVRFANGDEVRAHSVLLAPGSTYRRLGIPGEEDFIGAGVHFCATCDGPFYRGQEVLVVGGGNSAGEESIFLARFASKVTIATRGAALSASQVVVQKVEEHPKIEILTNVTPAEFRGSGHLESVILKDTRDGTSRELQPGGVFVFIGLRPNTEFLKGTIAINESGHIVTSATLETSIPGIFAAGDARAGSTKQLVSAAGEGATAALMIRQYLQSVHEAPSTVEMEREMAAAG